MTESSGGDCYDHLSMYDGTSTTSTSIASKLCGELTGEPEYNTTGNALTLKFVSDESAKDRGFAIVVIAFTPGNIMIAISCNHLKSKFYNAAPWFVVQIMINFEKERVLILIETSNNLLV